MINITFNFSSKSGVNSGIIATIFSTCVIFSNMFFYFIYNQKLSKYDHIGSLLIIASVVMIGMGNAKSAASDTNMTNLILAIVSAILGGLAFSLNSINLNYIVKTIKFPIN